MDSSRPGEEGFGAVLKGRCSILVLRQQYHPWTCSAIIIWASICSTSGQLNRYCYCRFTLHILCCNLSSTLAAFVAWFLLSFRLRSWKGFNCICYKIILIPSQFVYIHVWCCNFQSLGNQLRQRSSRFYTKD